MPGGRWVWLEDDEEEEKEVAEPTTKKTKVMESVLTCLFKKKFNRRSNNLSVQAASYTFSEVVVEIRENGEEEQVIAVTYMWKCAINQSINRLLNPSTRSDFPRT